MLWSLQNVAVRALLVAPSHAAWSNRWEPAVLIHGSLIVAYAAVCLQIFFLVPTTFIMHNFWALQAGTPAHQIEFVNFMKVTGTGAGAGTENSC